MRLANPNQSRLPYAVLLLLALGHTALSYAKTPDNIHALNRQMSLAEDVISTAIRAESDDLRVKKVQTHYLADQGVVMQMSISEPVIRIESGENSIQIDANFDGLNAIPEIVQEILSELDIDVPSEAHVVEVEELRSLRSEQRTVRKAQRALRSDLRQLRRKLVRQGDQERISTERQIAALEQELDTLEAEYDALNGDVERHYDRLDEIKQNARIARTAIEESTHAEANEQLEALVLSAVCQYGKTLSALDSSESLSIVVQQRKANDRHFVFEMADVNDCGKDEIDIDELREEAWIY